MQYLRSKKVSNFTVVVDKHRVPIVKDLFFFRSNVFWSQLEDSSVNECIFEDISYDAMIIVIVFSFVGTPIVSDDLSLRVLLDVHRFAIKYEMPKLSDGVEQYLEEYEPKNLQEMCVLSMRSAVNMYKHYLNWWTGKAKHNLS